jgi:hypothetical protein
MGATVKLRRKPRPLCPDLEPGCLSFRFCDAWRCAVDLRRGLTGELAHCPMCGIGAVATYRSRRRRAA